MTVINPDTAVAIASLLFALDVVLLLYALEPVEHPTIADGGQSQPPVDCTACPWKGSVDELKRVDKKLELALCPDCLTTKLEYTEPTNGGDHGE